MKNTMLFLLLFFSALLIAQDDIEVKLGLDIIPSEGLRSIYFMDFKALRSSSHFETYMQCWGGNPWGTTIADRWYYEYIDDIDSLTWFSHLERKKRKSLDSHSKGKTDEIRQLTGYSRKSMLLTCRSAQIIIEGLTKKGRLVKTGVSVSDITIYQMNVGKEKRKAFLAKVNVDRIIQSDNLNSLTNTIETMSGKEEAIAYSVEVFDLLEHRDMYGQVWLAEFSYWRSQNIEANLADKSGSLSKGSRYNRNTDKSRIDLEVLTIIFDEKITKKWIRFTAGDNSSALLMANYAPPSLKNATRGGYLKIAQYEVDNAKVEEKNNCVSKNIEYTQEIIDYMKVYRIKKKEREDAEKQH